MILIEYKVIEHFPNDAPELFGFERFPADRAPCVGDVVTLHWIDGRVAYDVRVDRIVGTTLHVRSAECR